MATRRNSHDDEVSYDFRGEAGQVQPSGDRRRGTEQAGNPIIDYMLELPTSHIKDSIALGVAEYLQSYSPSKDRLHTFLASANASRYLGVGTVGFMETARHEVLFEHVTDLLANSPIRGRSVRVVAGIGALYPINLYELSTGLAWLREHDDETYRRLSKEGLRSPGDLFDGRLREAPHLLLASADVRGGVTGDQLAIARYVVKKHVGLGCSILLTVSDIEMTHTGAFGSLTKGIKTFDLGRF